MAGTIRPAFGIEDALHNVVSMESGLDGRNNLVSGNDMFPAVAWSQWSPA